MFSGSSSSFTVERQKISQDGFELCLVSPEDIENLTQDFSSNPDLNDFFKNDCLLYEKDLLAKTYKLIYQEKPEIILGLISLSNDALRFEGRSQRDNNVPHRKRGLNIFPAVKIGRLAINKEFDGKGLGTFLISLVKKIFLTENRTGCRFITVDAYNQSNVLNFYRKNLFVEIKKKDPDDAILATVSMFYNLQHVKL